MLKQLKRKIYLSNPVYVLLFSIFLVLFFAFPSVILKFNINIFNKISLSQSISSILSELLLAICIVTVFIYILSFSRVLLKVFVSFFIIFSCIFSYYVLFNHVILDEFFIATIFETPIRDAGSAISLGLFVYCFFFGVLPFIFWIYVVKIRYYGKSFISKISKYLLSLFLAISVLFLFFVSSYLLNKDMYSSQAERRLKTSLSLYMPLNYVAGMYQYFFQIRPKTNIETKVNISKIYPFSFYDDKFKNENYTVILVLGESSRAKNQQMNGYFRKTNPLLSKEKNLINFTDVSSCGTYTAYSVNCMLSHKKQKDFVLNTEESNLISAFKSLVFATYYFSTQPLYNEISLQYFLVKDADIKVFANQVRTKIPSNNHVYDEYLLDFVKDIDFNKSKKRLIILHLMTSHTPYKQRYPEKFNVFKSQEGSVIDEYDNTVLYTDYIMDKLIGMFKDKKTFLYFSSDHGESLGENGVYLHASSYDVAPKEQKHVFQFVWASDSMINMMGSRYNNIKEKANLSLSHDNLFSSLFDCMGIKSSIVNKNLSLCKEGK